MARSGFGNAWGRFTQNATKKSSELIESARLSAEVNRLEQSIGDLQYELGKAYYDDNKNRSIGPYIELIKKINLLDYELRQKQGKLLARRGQSYCESCDTIVSFEDGFCSKCGAPVQKEKYQEQTTQCVNCDAAVGLQDVYCPKCGILLTPLEGAKP